MTIRHMRIFIEVYQTQNITKAAERLNMTQPAVTRAVQELEHYYGVRLFERINRRLSITETGKELYQQALHIISSFDSLEKNLYNWETFGIIRIGASITLGNHLLPDLLLQFKATHPHIQLKTMILNSAGLQTALMENKLDLALIENNVEAPELKAKPFSRDKLVLITPLDHPLLQQEQILLSDLTSYDLIMRENGSAGRSYLNHIFASHDLNLQPASISISTQAIIRYVQRGLGISLLPEQLVKEDIEKGNIASRDIANVKLERKHYIVWHENKYLSPTMKEFITLCVETLKNQYTVS